MNYFIQTHTSIQCVNCYMQKGKRANVSRIKQAHIRRNVEDEDSKKERKKKHPMQTSGSKSITLIQVRESSPYFVDSMRNNNELLMNFFRAAALIQATCSKIRMQSNRHGGFHKK